MPSQKLTRILLAKSPYSQELIDRMSEAEGWAWVHSQLPPKKDPGTQICFTGFRLDRKKHLADLAEAVGLRVVGSVTKRLKYLCVGENAGPAKVAKARRQGVVPMDEAEFVRLLETGDLLD